VSARLLSIAQLAERWGWRPQALYRLIAARAIPYVRIGTGRGRIYFEEAAVEQWLEARRRRPAEVAPRAASTRSRADECQALGIPVEHLFS
jgi:excisionase family DNA binding protein